MSASTTTAALTKSGELLLAQYGLSAPALLRIRAGRNSRVWRVNYSSDSYVLKEYFRHPGDPRDRLTTEYDFLSFLRGQGITSVPKPLARDDTGEAALYSFQPGITITTVTSSHIAQAANFITLINHYRETSAGRSLPTASEACFSINDHMNRVRVRLEDLQSALDELPEVERSGLRQLLGENLWPFYHQIAAHISANTPESARSADLGLEQRILSPSDFGFHNVLEDGGALYFLDFEYAGWDDPAKLLCDFASQPQIPVTSEQATAFFDQLFPEPNPIRERTRLLLPLYRLKWCCILLNVFRSRDRQRRSHAGDIHSESLSSQLEKARWYFSTWNPK